jgi:hypothetical protein
LKRVPDPETNPKTSEIKTKGKIEKLKKCGRGGGEQKVKSKSTIKTPKLRNQKDSVRQLYGSTTL